MPGYKYYTVTEEREIKVKTRDVIEAARMATHMFNGAEVHVFEDLEGHAVSGVEVKALNIREDY